MANTFHQLYVQIVFSVKRRESLIPKTHREEIHKYITGIIKNNKCKMIAINSVEDHIHIFVGLKPTVSISNLVKDIKTSTTELIKDKRWNKNKFNWQDGFGAFSYSHSHIDKVVKYINNQELHHRKQSFAQEYKEFMERFDIDHDEKYLLDI